jgi:hypothetical protein
MSVAYCIAAHTGPAQCARLVHRVLQDDPESWVFLHYDQRRSPPFDPSQVAHPRVHLFRERPIYWGSTQLADLYLEMFRWARHRDPTYIVMLSGQDYPLRNLAGLEAELAAFDVWAETMPVFGDDGCCQWPEGLRRYSYRWWHLDAPPRPVRGAERLVAKAVRVPAAPTEPPLPYIVRHRQADQFWWGARSRGPGVPVHGGSVYMNLSSRAVDVLLSCPHRLASFFHHVPCSDEAWFHTVLRNTAGLSFAPGNARYIRWAQGEAHPDVLGLGDLDDLVSSGDHFGRKFDEAADSAVLDRLDALAHSMSGQQSQNV